MDTEKKGVTHPRSEAEELLMRALILLEKEKKDKAFRAIRCPKTNLYLCSTNGATKIWCRKCKCEHEFDGSGRLVI